MRLPAFDLGAFFVSQIVGKEAAFRFDDEIQSMCTVLLYQHRPIRVYVPNGVGMQSDQRESLAGLGLPFRGAISRVWSSLAESA